MESREMSRSESRVHESSKWVMWIVVISYQVMLSWVIERKYRGESPLLVTWYSWHPSWHYPLVNISFNIEKYICLHYMVGWRPMHDHQVLCRFAPFCSAYAGSGSCTQCVHDCSTAYIGWFECNCRWGVLAFHTNHTWSHHSLGRSSTHS